MAQEFSVSYIGHKNTKTVKSRSGLNFLMILCLVHRTEKINIRNNKKELTLRWRIFVKELVRKCPVFVKHWSSSPRSEVTEIWRYILPVESVPQLHILFPQNQFQYYFLIPAWVSQSGFQTLMVMGKCGITLRRNENKQNTQLEEY
jgi:hypothetical protein